MKRLIPIFIFVFVANTLLAYDFKQKQICYSIMTLGESDTPVAVVSQQEATADNYKRITELVIPETVKYKGTEYPVAAVGNDAFKNAHSLVSVTLPASVVQIQSGAFVNCIALKQVTCLEGSMLHTIDDDAFSGCISLTDLNLGHKLQHIGQRAFISCTSLQTINLGTALKRINERAFAHCTALTSFTIPVSTEYLGKDIFDGCTSLTSLSVLARSCKVDKEYMSNAIKAQITHISFGNGVEHIPAYLCQGMTQLKSVSMSNSLKSISQNAFSGCTALADLALPETLQEIHEHAFEGCTSLSHIRIPKNVTTLHPKAFQGCSSLTSIEWCPVNFESNHSESIFEAIATQITRFTFDANVSSVPSRLCQGMTSLSSVSLPSNITKIGDCAFERCSSMPSILFSNNLQTIGSEAFSGCTSLTSVTLPNSVTTCGSGAFEGCTQLRSFNLSTSMTSISSKMLKGCSSLDSVTFTSSINNIESEAFSGCTSLTSVTLPNTLTNCGSGAFEDCTQLSSFTFSTSMTSISSKMFKGCSSLQSIELLSSINNIESEAFANCSSLTAIHHPTGNLNMAENALANCSAILLLPYLSSDLKMMLVRGRVKSIVDNNSGYSYLLASGTLDYTYEGMLVSTLIEEDSDDEDYDEDCTTELERNSEGQLLEIGDCSWGDSWTYNEDGFVATHSMFDAEWGRDIDYTYEYNENNDVVKANCVFTSSEGKSVDTIIYSNYKYDGYGNWISRDATQETKSYNYDVASDSYVYDAESDTSVTRTETRVIIYY
ncbi:MAG: leucine-rich repeat protein [Paludibacteraceae bacterium]|nr:leucine-rich repeat protein [Paludibacteraceae bacterium]